MLCVCLLGFSFVAGGCNNAKEASVHEAVDGAWEDAKRIHRITVVGPQILVASISPMLRKTVFNIMLIIRQNRLAETT